jgi:F-type H+-transporting ATPase subunit epsilon
MKTFLFEIVTPEKTFFSGHITSLVVPASKGRMGVLAGHMKMIVQVISGKIEIGREGLCEFFVTKGGLAKIDKDRVVLMCEEIEAVVS